MEIKNLIKENVVFHCDTEEKANELLKKAHELGYKWQYGFSYLDNNYYIKCEEDTCYYINQGSYGGLGYYIDEGFKIIEYVLDRDCDFTLDDLQTGMLVTFRSGEQAIVIKDIKQLNEEYTSILVNTDYNGYELLVGWGIDLKRINKYHERDIVKVEVLNYALSVIVNRKQLKYLNKSQIIWERKEVEEMTLEQVCKELGREIKIIK